MDSLFCFKASLSQGHVASYILKEIPWVCQVSSRPLAISEVYILALPMALLNPAIFIFLPGFCSQHVKSFMTWHPRHFPVSFLSSSCRHAELFSGPQHDHDLSVILAFGPCSPPGQSAFPTCLPSMPT